MQTQTHTSIEKIGDKVLHCPECNTVFPDSLKYGLFECDQCQSRLVRTLDGIRSRELTNSEKLTRFNNRVGKSAWTIELKDGPTKEVKPVTGLRCLICYGPIEVVASVYVKAVVDWIKREFTTLEKFETPANEGHRFGGSRLAEVRKKISLPVIQKGWSCKPCFDRFHAIKYEDWEGEEHSVMEPIDPPVAKTVESISRNHRSVLRTVPVARPSRPTRDDNYPQGRERVKSVTQVLHNKSTGEVEEWVVAPEKKPEPEPVDPAAYRHFMNPGRRPKGSGRR